MPRKLYRWCWELPPRARRIPLGDENATFPTGTTSACAENTGAWVDALVEAWNYLRVRGEYPASISSIFKSSELPPRARRIHVNGLAQHAAIGTTSACAENTFCLVG